MYCCKSRICDRSDNIELLAALACTYVPGGALSTPSGTVGSYAVRGGSSDRKGLDLCNSVTKS
eukprot:3691340-Lingulodinium_polyedra.AAC.1